MCPGLVDVMASSSSFSLELSMGVIGCPAMNTRGTIVGETEGVERVEEAGDSVSSSDCGRNAAEGDDVGLGIEEDDDA
jgi:hypothetical protein